MSAFWPACFPPRRWHRPTAAHRHRRPAQVAPAPGPGVGIPVPSPHRPPPADGLHPDFTPASFVLHGGVLPAFAAAAQAPGDPSGACQPVWLDGGRGLGKTHLLHAAGHSIKAAHPDAKVFAMSALRFSRDLAEAAQSGCTESLTRRLGGLDVLLLDHIEWLSGDPCGQEALVSILDAIGARHGKVVVASIHPPGDVEGLTPPVRARADSGLCVRMDMPDLDACMAILRVKAAECGYDPLPDALAHLLATQTFAKDGVRRLDYWLRRVLATADFTDRPVSPGLAKEVLNDASHA